MKHALSSPQHAGPWVSGNWLRDLGAQDFSFLISLAGPSGGILCHPPCDFSLFWEIDGPGFDLRCAAVVLNFPCLTCDADKAANPGRMAPGSSQTAGLRARGSCTESSDQKIWVEAGRPSGPVLWSLSFPTDEMEGLLLRRAIRERVEEPSEASSPNSLISQMSKLRPREVK